MINDISKSICDTIYQAVEQKNITSNKDITYLCTVTCIYPDNPNTYQLTYKDTDYTVTLNNITLNIYDEVHLVIPQGDFSKKYVLEDVCFNYIADFDTSRLPATPTREGLMSAADKKKLDGIENNSQANVQADWRVSDSSSDSFIKNKPISMPASDVYAWAKAETKPVYTKSEIGLGNVPNVTTDNQTPSFTQATTRTNIASGEKLSVILGKIKKWFSDLKSVAFSGSYNDLYDKPSIPVVGNGTVTVKQNGTSKGTFTMNQSGNTEIQLTDTNTTYSAATQSSNGLLSSADKKKLDGIASGANNYSLPAASSTVRGGVKTGYTANGKNYPVQLSNEQMYVNVPWTDTNTQTITGVKGNAESSYRTGNINLTPANIGAVSSSGGTVNGALTVTGDTTLQGNVRIKKASSNYGSIINIGDGDYIRISEETDDVLTVKARQININSTGSNAVFINGTTAARYKKLTQAEYNALSSSKNSDNIIYFISG